MSCSEHDILSDVKKLAMERFANKVIQRNG